MEATVLTVPTDLTWHKHHTATKHLRLSSHTLGVNARIKIEKIL